MPSRCGEQAAAWVSTRRRCSACLQDSQLGQRCSVRRLHLHPVSPHSPACLLRCAALLCCVVLCRYSEVVNYNFSDPGFKKAAAHFTQLVWKSTTLLGCAANLCGPVNGTEYQHGTLVVCR